jgi:hypothetical protein
MTIFQYVIDVGVIAMLFFMGYCILQVIEVIREERLRHQWARYDRASALRDQDDYSEPEANPQQDPKL